MKSFFVVMTMMSAIAQTAVAQNSTSSTGTITGTLEQAPSTPSNLNLIAGIYSYNDFARQVEMTSANPKSQNYGRVFKSKDELYLGVKNTEGWGVQAMMVPYYYNWNTIPSQQKYSHEIMGDPSLSFLHPIYKSDKLLLTGKFRQYFPVSDYSVSRSNWEQTYYFNLTWKLPNRIDFFNSLIPRYFSQANYQIGDTTFYTEDYTTLTSPLASWARIGIGQHSQVEVHAADPVGKTVEIYPLADLMLSPTVFMGPRIYFPVYTQNAVFDAPRSSALESVQTELYFQATL